VFGERLTSVSIRGAFDRIGSDVGIAICSLERIVVKPAHFCLAFPADQSDESSCANRAQKRIGRKSIMTNAETNTAAAVAEQGATVAPEKASSKKGASPKKGAPKGQKAAQSAKAKAAPKKEAKAPKKAAKREHTKVKPPRAESKGAKILAMIGRAKGATLAEIRKATNWQAHSVRGFLSTAAKKHGLKIESAKTEAGDRVYQSTK
jgi:hypothetical protein